MNQPPRDWDRELAEIDKAIEKQGSGAGGQLGSDPGAVPVPAERTGVPPARVAEGTRRAAALSWFWTLLAVALSVGLAVWPYERDCGLRLAFFLGATGITVLAGFLGALGSWAGRRGVAHLLSLLVLVWAGVVAAREILPRIGYAREVRTWLCPAETPVPQPQPVPAPDRTGQAAPAPAPTPQSTRRPSSDPGAPVSP